MALFLVKFTRDGLVYPQIKACTQLLLCAEFHFQLCTSLLDNLIYILCPPKFAFDVLLKLFFQFFAHHLQLSVCNSSLFIAQVNIYALFVILLNQELSVLL